MKEFTAMPILVNTRRLRTNGRLMILKPVIKGGEKREEEPISCFMV